MRDELVQKFNEVKTNIPNSTANDYLVNYFMTIAEKQIKNLNLDQNEKNERLEKCYRIIISNLTICYDGGNFIDKTLEDIKNAIYLNKDINQSNSSDIVNAQRDIIRSKLTITDLDAITDVKNRELARMFYFENSSIKKLALISHRTEQVVSTRLRRIATDLIKRKVSNSVIIEEEIIYRKQ